MQKKVDAKTGLVMMDGRQASENLGRIERGEDVPKDFKGRLGNPVTKGSKAYLASSERNAPKAKSDDDEKLRYNKPLQPDYNQGHPDTYDGKRRKVRK